MMNLPSDSLHVLQAARAIVDRACNEQISYLQDAIEQIKEFQADMHKHPLKVEEKPRNDGKAANSDDNNRLRAVLDDARNSAGLLRGMPNLP